MKTEPVVVQWTKEDLERLMRTELDQKGFELETELDPAFQEPPPDPKAKRKRRKKKYPLGFEWSMRKGDVLVRTVVRSRPMSENEEEGKEAYEESLEDFALPEEDDEETEDDEENDGMKVSLLRNVDMKGLNETVAREEAQRKKKDKK